MRYIALDLDKNNALAATFDSTTQQAHQERIPLMRDPISLNLFLDSLRPDDILVMEAQRGSSYLHDLCKPRVRDVKLIEPQWLGAILHKLESKTDRNDTGVMLALARANVLKTVWVPPIEVRTQRTVAAHYQHLDEDRTRWTNRVHALLVEYGLAYEAAELLKSDMPLVFAKFHGKMPPAALEVLASNMRMLRQAEEELRLARAHMEATIHPEREVAVTLPGFDTLLAYIALAYIGDVRRFPNAGSLINYCLAPSNHSTGGKTRHGKLKRRASCVLRWVFIEAAQSARKATGPLRNVYRRKRGQRKSHDQAVVVVAAKLAEILWHMLTKGEVYRYVEPKAEERKKQRRRRRLQAAQGVLKAKPDYREVLRQNFANLRDVLHQMAS